MSGNKLLDTMNWVREQSGREPLPNPNVIEGFGPGTAPVPDLPDELPPPVPSTWLDDDEELDQPPPSTAPSPLVQLAVPAPPSTPVTPQPSGDALMILDDKASYRGRAVALTSQEQSQIVQVVLKAQARVVREDLKSIEQQRTSRPYTRKAKPEPPKKKRGRPKRESV